MAAVTVGSSGPGAESGNGGAAPGQVHMHICAHPADDLFFFAPDLWQSADAGAALVTVFLTAGQRDGAASHVAARQRGIRAAYAKMLVGDASATWSRREWELSPGLCAEIADLTGGSGSHCSLIFVNLSDPADGPSLRELWQGSIGSLPTVPGLGSPLSAVGAEVAREQLLDALLHILHANRPNLVRVMDPDPDCRDYDPDGESVFADHPAHTAAALFGVEAVRRYCADSADSRPLVLEAYRGERQADLPFCLEGEALTRKMGLLAVYGGQDGRDVVDETAPGDEVVGAEAFWRRYGNSTSLVYPPSVSWLAEDQSGRVTAVAVRDGLPVLFEAGDASGRWVRASLPHPALKGGQFAPRVDLVPGQDGRLHVFGTYIAVGAEPGEHVRTVLTSFRSRGGSFTDWQDLGNPYDSARYNPVRRRGVGTAAPVALPDGGVAFFQRNFGTGVSGRRQVLGHGWSPWLDLGGTTETGYSAVLGADGAVELFACGENSLLRWRETPDGTELERDPGFLLPASAGPVTAIATPEAGLRLYARQRDTAWVLEYRQDPADHLWSAVARLVGAPGGTGPVAAACAPDGSACVLAVRNRVGTVSIAWVDSASSQPAQWTAGGPLCTGSPAVLFDGSGRCVVAAVGADARLSIAAVERSSDGSAKPTWRQVAG